MSEVDLFLRHGLYNKTKHRACKTLRRNDALRIWAIPVTEKPLFLLFARIVIAFAKIIVAA